MESDKVQLKGSDKVVIEQGGNLHQYSKNEVASFANLINKTLKDDPHVASRLPVNPEGEELFDKVSDGLILAKLIEKAQPGAIDFRAFNMKSELNIFQLKENLNLMIASAKAIGLRIISIFPETFIEKRAYMILGMAWQVLRAVLLSHLNLKDNPYLARLLKEDEDLETFKKQNPEQILIRWFNFHLKNAKHDRQVTNFSNDVKDCVNYTVLLNQLDNSLDKSGLNDDEKTRASKVISNSEKLGVSTIVTDEDILSGNPKLNLILTCLIYNAKHGLEPATETEKEKVEEIIEQFEKASLTEEKSDPNDTREERAFRNWANSLEVTDVKGNQFFFNNLYDDLQDSIMLLKLLEKLGIPVDWKKVNKEPGNKFKVLENCKYAVEVAKSCKDFKLVNIGGNDFYEKNQKLILGLMWQMARKHTLDTLGGVSEDELLKWSNATAKTSKNAEPIKGFNDQSLKTGKFLFALLNAVEPRAIDWDVVKNGDNDEEVELNCKYVISVCRRLNVPVFCVWEDLRDVKPKMILVLIASIRKEVSAKDTKTA